MTTPDNTPVRRETSRHSRVLVLLFFRDTGLKAECFKRRQVQLIGFISVGPGLFQSTWKNRILNPSKKSHE